MREIIFRGKHKTNGAWVYGFYVHCADRWGRDKDLIQSLDPESEEIGLLHEVDRETVGQFTGLTDKNGKKIFEGDVVRVYGEDLPRWNSVGQKVTVEYSFEYGGYKPFCEYDSDCGEYVEAGLCEVIGNIYDNPELLKGE